MNFVLGDENIAKLDWAKILGNTKKKAIMMSIKLYE